MEQLIATIEKGQPFFNARSPATSTSRRSATALSPSSPSSSSRPSSAWWPRSPTSGGFYWPDDINNALWKCYNYSMGIPPSPVPPPPPSTSPTLRTVICPRTTRSTLSPACARPSSASFLLLSSDTIATDAASGFNTTYLGSKGLLTAFIAAFVTASSTSSLSSATLPSRCPEQVPPNISQTFKDIIPFSVCITVFGSLTSSSALPLASALPRCHPVFQPLFTAADGYIGLAVIYGAMSLFWFVGVHGPSIVEPAIAAALVANMTDNPALTRPASTPPLS